MSPKNTISLVSSWAKYFDSGIYCLCIIIYFSINFDCAGIMTHNLDYFSEFYAEFNVSNYAKTYDEDFNISSSSYYLYDYDTIFFQPDEERLPAAFKWIILTLYGIVIIFSVLGNMTTFLAYKRHIIPNSKTNFFITVISINDVGHILCEMFLAVSNILFNSWVYLPVMCPMIVYPRFLTVSFRAFVLVVMTVDKHLAVWKPIKRNRHQNRNIAKVVALFALLISVLISLPSALYTRISYVNIGRTSYVLCLEMWADLEAKYIYSVTMMIMQYFLPILVMGISYTHIIVILHRHRIPGEVIPKRDARMMISKKQVHLKLSSNWS